MKTTTLKLGAIALAIAVAGCGDAPAAEKAPTGATTTEGSKTLAATLGDQSSFGTLKTAIDTAELASLFDGPASYTLLAPDNAAFDKVGDKAKALMAPEQKALLVAVLRNHLVPGHLTPEAIEKAIVEKNGKVTMTTLGDGTISFTKDGDAIIASTADGVSARVNGGGIAANNGVIIPLDSVLLPKEDGAAQ